MVLGTFNNLTHINYVRNCMLVEWIGFCGRMKIYMKSETGGIEIRGTYQC